MFSNGFTKTKPVFETTSGFLNPKMGTSHSNSRMGFCMAKKSKLIEGDGGRDRVQDQLAAGKNVKVNSGLHK